MSQLTASPASARALVMAAAVGAGLLFSAYSGGLVRPMLTDPAFQTPYLASFIVNLSDLMVMAALVGVARPADPVALVRLSGLTADIFKPLVWAVALFVPAVVTALLVSPLSTGFNASDLFWQGVGFPAMEEVVYRGLAVAALIRWAGWSWPAACVAPAVFFGLAHLGQGSEPMEVAGIVAITGLGGLLFGWLFVRWGFNLWPPILLHIGMNSLWILFDLGETALGGLLGNGLRLAVIAGAVGLTLWMTRKRIVELSVP